MMVLGAGMLVLFALVCVVMALNPGEGGTVGTVTWLVLAAAFIVGAVVVLRQRR